MSRQQAKTATPVLRRLSFGAAKYGGHLQSSGVSCRGSLSESVQQCRGERVGAASVRQNASTTFDLRQALQATALLQLSATAQRVEMIARFLLQQQHVPQVLIEAEPWQARQPFIIVCNMLQAHHELHLQLNHALQQLFQLSYTLQAHAEQNSAHSQQLQLQTGVTSKVS